VPDSRAPRPAVFLDRDGTIAEEVGYLNHPSRFRMFPFVAAAIRRLNEAGLPVVVVTNQSGVGRGYFPESFVSSVNEMMMVELAAAEAAREHSLYLPRSFVVGDRYDDIELARNVRARGILVRTGYGEGELAWHSAKWPTQSDFVAEDLSKAANWILRQSR
jgi:D-glycero-D-manno-heptose 1,7-bisphosphate phosphatase